MPYEKLEDYEKSRIAQEIVDHATRQAYRRFALDVYGLKSHYIKVAWGEVYNDESTDFRIIDVEVYDKEGNLLAPDMSRDFWKKWAAPGSLNASLLKGRDMRLPWEYGPLINGFILPRRALLSEPSETRLRPLNDAFYMEEEDYMNIDLYVER